MREFSRRDDPSRLCEYFISDNLPFHSHRFSPALKKLHKELKTLRDRAFKLQTTLRKQYSSKNLTLKTLPRIGPVAHIVTRDGVLKLEADESAHLYQKSNSTRAYIIRVSLSYLFPFLAALD